MTTIGIFTEDEALLKYALQGGDYGYSPDGNGMMVIVSVRYIACRNSHRKYYVISNNGFHLFINIGIQK